MFCPPISGRGVGSGIEKSQLSSHVIFVPVVSVSGSILIVFVSSLIFSWSLDVARATGCTIDPNIKRLSEALATLGKL